MFKAICRLFIKDSENVSDPKVRSSYGKLSGIFGIILNIILSAGKIVAGVLTSAISIISDGINNLSDATSSVITLLGFKLSSKKPDKKHPYGYGRVEYFAGLAISVVIIFIAITLLKDSVTKIIDGEILDISLGFYFYLTIGILAFSILVKFFMASFNVYMGNKINSPALKATFLDCVCDCISTLVVLTCTVISLFVKDFPLDGACGIVVSLFIGYTGGKSIIDIISPLLGEAPDPDMVKELKTFVMDYDKSVVGVHDLMFHDYGPGRKLVVLHVEVPAENDIMEMHDMIDNIEREIEQKFNCVSTIHMDPVITTSERLNQIKMEIYSIVKGINPAYDIHDFRMNEGATHANVIFDLVVDRESNLPFEEVNKIVTEKIKEYDKKLNVVINVEYNLV